MTTDKNTITRTRSTTWIITGILLSGLAWYFADGLNGDLWYIMWLAPVPVLLLSLKTSAKWAFVIAFAAYLIGRLSWFSYLVRVATLVPAIVVTLLPALVFALIILASRWCIMKINAWYTVFAFPVFFTLFEYSLINFSKDGTAASIAYSQMNCIPMIQVAAVAGILGITFIITFIPSAIALGWYYRATKAKLWAIAGTATSLLIVVFLYGELRIAPFVKQPKIDVGLTSLDENIHSNSDHPNLEKEKQVTIAYMEQVKILAAQGARIVLLPERAIGIDKAWANQIIAILDSTAKQNHVYIIAGYTNQRNMPERNSAIVIDPNGNVSADYNKTHLVTGFENQFTPGGIPGLFKFNGVQSGVAICKDLDFQAYLKQYGENKPGFIFVPAWDFIVDDWLHGRMAILRGVENGFSEIRSARLGRLTVSDQYGRITAETVTSNKKQASLLGSVSPQHINTLYTQWGDWLGMVCLLAALAFVFVGWRK